MKCKKVCHIFLIFNVGFLKTLLCCFDYRYPFYFSFRDRNSFTCIVALSLRRVLAAPGYNPRHNSGVIFSCWAYPYGPLAFEPLTKRNGQAHTASTSSIHLLLLSRGGGGWAGAYPSCLGWEAGFALHKPPFTPTGNFPKSPMREPTWTPHRKAPGSPWESNPGPYCCEATVLAITPHIHQRSKVKCDSCSEGWCVVHCDEEWFH